MENFKILEEKENPLFNRREVKFNIDAQVTPSHADVEKFISEKFFAQLEAIKIKGIHGGFGSKTFTISASIYKTREDKENTEPKSKKKKEEDVKTIEPAQVTEQAASETPSEKPAEEQKIKQVKPEEKTEEKKEEQEPKPEEKTEEKKEEGKLSVKKP